MKSVTGKIIDIRKREIIHGRIIIDENGKINRIEASDNVDNQYILPGFIDAHIHIESSMLTPFEFAKMALSHGTVATVSDPHEIANVCGMEGVQYMINDAKGAKLKFFFGAPSCVPATTFESTGSVIGTQEVDELMSSEDIWYLSEMMNYPGVLNEDPVVLEKIAIAKKYNKPVDGHAPGLTGESAGHYIKHGISTDHECTRLEEALDKIGFGMKIIIREGSAARNYDALHPLIKSNYETTMFCSDDKHPDELLNGHINLLVKRSLKLGYDLFDVLRIACINPVEHYKIPVGTLQEGDFADFITVKDLESWKVLKTYINGEVVSENGKTKLGNRTPIIINNFNRSHINTKDIQIKWTSKKIPVIVAKDGELITEMQFIDLKNENGFIKQDPKNDILKICVVNRYNSAPPAVGFIKNFGLKKCAIASTVAHDSHNIVAVGSDDDLLTEAINILISSQGGLSVVTSDNRKSLSLPIAGLISDKSAIETGNSYKELSEIAKQAGSKLRAPFMTLSFMALLVIPKIKISDKGMFDAEKFRFFS